MKGKITVIPAGSGEITSVEVEDANVLNHLQAAVHGFIESVPYWTVYEGEPCAVFCNEDGKGEGLPLNAMATALWQVSGGAPCVAAGDYLVGAIAIVTGDAEFMEAL